MKISERLSKWLNALFREAKVEHRVNTSDEVVYEPSPPSSGDSTLASSAGAQRIDELPNTAQPSEKTATPEVRKSKKPQTQPVQHVTPVIFSESKVLAAETVSEFRELIQLFFDQEQQSTDPWIKLGIDLGTSRSKVVWRGVSDSFPVCFGDNNRILDSYLMPSVVGFEDGRIFTGFDAVAGQNQHTISNFKMCLACFSDESSKCNMESCSLDSGWQAGQFNELLKGEEVKFVNAVFLAKLLSKSMQIITDKLTIVFREPPRPKWTANLAVPEKFIEKSPIAASFREVFRTAWLMSNVFRRFPELATFNLIANCYVAAHEIAIESLSVLEDGTFGCSIYPEVGAEVASIVMNKNSDEALYAFVDVGAGTIDASLFNYFREGSQPNRPPFATEISKDLGAAYIETFASAASAYSKAGSYSADELKKVKEDYNHMTASEKAAVKSQFLIIKYAAGKIGKASEAFLTEVFRWARDKKYPGIVNQRILLVLGGGGAALKTYQTAATEAFTSKHATEPRPPEVTILRKPDKFQMSPLPSEEFHRFAVAYGLSFPIEDLPDHILCKDVEMIVPPKQHDWSFNPLYD